MKICNRHKTIISGALRQQGIHDLESNFKAQTLINLNAAGASPDILGTGPEVCPLCAMKQPVEYEFINQAVQSMVNEKRRLT